ncbi:MAG TPA: E3 ubiquitin--protein ligase [Gammaproteobacteria bacterium]|nr:E3 ubiquitin--protein ligase [Gammaproteobacteria bacterium]
MLSGFAQDVQVMSTLKYAMFVLLVTAALGYLFYLIWRNFHRARVIEDTPTARVRSAAQGYVELEGRGRSLPERQVIAPLTKIPCVWYRFKIEKEQHSSRGGSNWTKVESGSSEDPFVFYDRTGDCLVDPRQAEVTPGTKKVWYGKSRWPGGAERKGLLGMLVGRRYRYTEERIDPGSLYVLGWFDTLRSTDQSVGAEVSGLLRDWKQDQATLNARFDKNRDGQIDADEWQQARKAAQREVVQDRAARSAQAAVNIVRASGHDRYPFLISAKPQQSLSSRYRRNAIFSLLGSVFAAGVLAWMLVVRLQA